MSTQTQQRVAAPIHQTGLRQAGATTLARHEPEPNARPITMVLGTRPEIVKVAPVARELGGPVAIAYTGQHYDENMAGAFFDDFDLPRPSAVVGVGGKHRGLQIGEAVSGLTRAWLQEPPRAVVVQGDTNSALAGALAANGLSLPLVHVEAGLRSFDRSMPEEHNRVVIDHLCDLALAPTSVGADNLERERVPATVVVTGNTVVDAVRAQLPTADTARALIVRADLVPSGFAVATIHRPENADDPRRLQTILGQLGALPIPVLLPMHPRTERQVTRFGLRHLLDRLRVIPPLDYPTFLAFASQSAFLVSDSGGIAEEITVYKRPAMIVRRSTERVEVLGSFAALVEPDAIGDTADEWLRDPAALHRRLATAASPYGEGDAGRLSAQAIREHLA